MKTTFAWSTAICCLSLLFGGALQAENMANYKGQCLDPNGSYADGPCVCYCPMVKFKPKYHCEQKCYLEAYQVPKKCCRYVPEQYTKTFCKMVPQYYTKTFCRQVPEYYTTCETKYRKKYYTTTHCTYEPCRYTVKKCNVCPTNTCEPSCPSPCEPACDPCSGYAQPVNR